MRFVCAIGALSLNVGIELSTLWFCKPSFHSSFEDFYDCSTIVLQLRANALEQSFLGNLCLSDM